MLVNLTCCCSASDSQIMLIWLSVYLELKIVKFLVWYFCAAQSDLIPCGDMKQLIFSLDNSVATVYFRFVLSCYTFLHQTLPINVPKYSTESNSLCLKIYSGNNMLLSGSCHLPIQIISQVFLRDSSNFLWSSLFLSSDLLKSSGISLPVPQNCLSPKTAFPALAQVKEVTLF